eukprot:93980-Chlamydomonas_euryale.AAC.2
MHTSARRRLARSFASRWSRLAAVSKSARAWSRVSGGGGGGALPSPLPQLPSSCSTSGSSGAGGCTEGAHGACVGFKRWRMIAVYGFVGWQLHTPLRLQAVREHMSCHGRWINGEEDSTDWLGPRLLVELKAA